MLLNLLLLFILIFATFIGIMFLFMRDGNLSFWEKLPRNRIAGWIIGFFALLAFIPNVKPVFDPISNLYWLIPSIVILSWLCYLYLDHLLARAAAGAVILLIHAVLAESYSADLHGEWFFALGCFAVGTYAICIAAKPYWLRDSFRAMCHQFHWRLTAAVLVFLWAFSALILFIQHYEVWK